MAYLSLQHDLQYIAEAAKLRLEQKYSIKITKFEVAFDNLIDYAPTFFGKTSSHYIVCEVASRPFPVHLKSIYTDIQHQSLPVKFFIAYDATDLPSNDVLKDITMAKKFGIGLLNVDGQSSITNIVAEPVSIPLIIPESNLELTKINKKFSHKIEEAYSTYMNGNPRLGVQAIGQTVERLIRDVAIKKYGTAPYISGPDPNLDSSSFGNIVDEMISHSILNRAYLNRVRAFIDDRNSTSHITKSIKKQKDLEKKYKLLFETGLRILKELPINLKEKSINFSRID